MSRPGRAGAPPAGRPVLDRRVQILLSPEQYSQLEREAARTGQSVAAVIRESITDHLSGSTSGRSAAAQRLLQAVEPAQSPADDWATTKSALEHELVGKLP